MIFIFILLVVTTLFVWFFGVFANKNRHFVLLIIDISKHGAKEMGHLKMAGPGFVNDVTAGAGHYSDSPLLRRPIIPTAHCSDNPLFRQKWSKVV
jgi:hypothetical protein